MFELTVLAVCLTVGIGLLAKFLLAKFAPEDAWGDSWAISWTELAVVSFVLAAIVAPSASAIGTQLSVSEQLQYEQFVNGVETQTIDAVTVCTEGYASSSSASTGQSNCAYSYISGYYHWYWTETITSCTTDSKGNQSCTTSYVTHTETAPIETPYASREHHYTINSWMYDGKDGQMAYTFPRAYLDAKPERYRGSNREIPDNLPKGAPADWLDAKSRLDASDPRAVTKIGTYKNYILASKDDVLKTYGPRLDEYKAAGLLPDHTANINGNPITGPSESQADKISFVGVNVPDKDAWQKSVMRFNAALGTKLQGDLHVVLIDAATVPWNDAVPYTQSLKAYWQSDAFGRRAIAKNGIILVMGVDKATNTVAWADATTGMPFGNETMIQFLRDNLPGKALEPATLFGTPRTIVKGASAEVTHPAPEGLVESIVFETAPFKRFSMSCDNENCIGYKDLASKIQPTLGAKVWVVIGTIFISLILWVVTARTTFIDSAKEWVQSNILPNRKERQDSKDTETDNGSRYLQYPFESSDSHGRTLYNRRRFK